MIRVTIEHHCQPGKENQLRDLLLELRTMAMHQPGYISGETLRELINPSLFNIISIWSTLEDWKKWHRSEQRMSIEEKVNSITNDGMKLRIFTEDHKK
ncbi:MAG: antibiotic biosynthesis monooxygenase family protein [Syntrophales bacterium]|jgi:heme-degrading monooxygenase HmoA